MFFLFGYQSELWGAGAGKIRKRLGVMQNEITEMSSFFPILFFFFSIHLFLTNQCISQLLLGNILPLKLESSNNKHLLAQRFCGSENQAGLSWVHLAQGLSWAIASHCQCSQRSLHGPRSVSQLVDMAVVGFRYTDFWLEAPTSCHVSLSVGQLPTEQSMALLSTTALQTQTSQAVGKRNNLLSSFILDLPVAMISSLP